MTEVLLVEDDPRLRATLLLQLRDEGLAADHAESAEDALARLEARAHPPELMLLDVRLPGMSGVDLVRLLVEGSRLPPTIILSGEASISETVEALRPGVHDFLEKPISKERLLQSIRNTLEHTALRREVEELRSELDVESQILGKSLAIEELRRQIEQAAGADATVLVTGESGTGKELVAAALQRESRRRSGPFVKINCAAIPAHLVEDELFGHVRGAFTDARSDKQGLFEAADGGTLFLDEIGDMEHALQSRLLRLLEERRVRRLGDTADRAVDVWVIAATNSDLAAAIAERRFRQDLYYRLATLTLEIAPLRERREDVRLLFHVFLRRLCRRERRPLPRVEEATYEVLTNHSWPGNVRQLKSLCERLVVFGTDPIGPERIPRAARLHRRPCGRRLAPRPRRWGRGPPSAGVQDALRARVPGARPRADRMECQRGSSAARHAAHPPPSAPGGPRRKAAALGPRRDRATDEDLVESPARSQQILALDRAADELDQSSPIGARRRVARVPSRYQERTEGGLDIALGGGMVADLMSLHHLPGTEFRLARNCLGALEVGRFAATC